MGDPVDLGSVRSRVYCPLKSNAPSWPLFPEKYTFSCLGSTRPPALNPCWPLCHATLPWYCNVVTPKSWTTFAVPKSVTPLRRIAGSPGTRRLAPAMPRPSPSEPKGSESAPLSVRSVIWLKPARTSATRFDLRLPVHCSNAAVSGDRLPGESSIGMELVPIVRWMPPE